MKTRKIILITALILCIAMTCSIAIGCTSKLQKTGGTKDGSPITADTDPDNIVSQKLNEKQWNSAMDVFKNLQNGMINNGFCNSVSCKSTVKYNGLVESVMEMKATKTAIYLKISEQETYMEYEEETGKYYLYTANFAGKFSKTEIPQSSLNQANSAMQKFEMDNNFGSYKYDKDVNGYVGKINYDALLEYFGVNLPEGITGTMTVKFVNNLPCYLKQEITDGNESMIAEAIYYDYDATVVELPQID